MTFGFSNNRTNIQNNVKTQQQLYKRFKTRFANTNNPSERTFLKREIANCVSQLKQFATQWKNHSYGSTTWITAGYNPVNVSSMTTKRSKASKRSTKRSVKSRSRRTHSKRKTRTTASRKTRSRANRTRRSYSFSF